MHSARPTSLRPSSRGDREIGGPSERSGTASARTSQAGSSPSLSLSSPSALFLELGPRRLARDAERLRGARLVAFAHAQARARSPSARSRSSGRTTPAGNGRLTPLRRPARPSPRPRDLGRQMLGQDDVLGLEQERRARSRCAARARCRARRTRAAQRAPRRSSCAGRAPELAAEARDEVLGEQPRGPRGARAAAASSIGTTLRRK